MQVILSLIVYVSLIYFKCLCANPKFYPNLPMGEYRLVFKGISSCIPPSNNMIQLNWYLSKKSINSTEIRGNVTSLLDIDDTLDLELKMTVKDSIGGWKDNAFVYKAPKGCSVLKNFLGNAWTPMLTGLGVLNTTCPVKNGVYVASGGDTSLIQYSNFPKTFFYGTYKFHLIFSKKNEMYACVIFIIDIIRPWE